MSTQKAATSGTFTGVGVGPGPEGLIPIAAVRAIQEADVILTPRAREKELSVATQCLKGLSIPAERLREVVYNMVSDKASLQKHYEQLALEVSLELEEGRNIVYLTIGDTLTYSTYSYMLQSLLKIAPTLRHRTIPGITSYAAVAAAIDWPIGQGKERTLILPCPDHRETLKEEIETHDVVVLMKIGHRMAMVKDVLSELNIASHCGFASRIGLPGELICKNLAELPDNGSVDYLSTMLIRKGPMRFTQFGDQEANK